MAQMVKNLLAMQETWIRLPGSQRSPREGNGYPPKYSFLKNSIDRGAWKASLRGGKELDMTESLTLFSTIKFRKQEYFTYLINICTHLINCTYLINICTIYVHINCMYINYIVGHD